MKLTLSKTTVALEIQKETFACNKGDREKKRKAIPKRIINYLIHFNKLVDFISNIKTSLTKFWTNKNKYISQVPQKTTKKLTTQ